MYDAVGNQSNEPAEYIFEVDHDLLFGESFALLDPFPQISPIAVLLDYIVMVLGFHDVYELDDVLRFELSHNLDFGDVGLLHGLLALN